MKKSSKIILGICIPLMVIAVVLIILIKMQKPEVYPASTLVYSVFTAENNTYQGSNNFPNVYSLTKNPYTIDVPNADQAHVGDGTVWEVNRDTGYYVYCTEIGEDKSLNTVIMEEFPKAVIYDYTSESTLSSLVSDTGYVNGFSAGYVVLGLNITNGKTSTDIVMVGYLLDIPDSSNDVFLAVTTNQVITEKMANTKLLADALIKTIQYNTDLAIEMGIVDKNGNPIIPVEEDTEELDEDYEYEEPEPEIEDTEESMPEEEGVNETKGIDLDKDYENAVLVISWDIPDSNAEVLVTDEEGNSYAPADKTDYQAEVNLGAINKQHIDVTFSSANNSSYSTDLLEKE